MTCVVCICDSAQDELCEKKRGRRLLRRSIKCRDEMLLKSIEEYVKIPISCRWKRRTLLSSIEKAIQEHGAMSKRYDLICHEVKNLRTKFIESRVCGKFVVEFKQ